MHIFRRPALILFLVSSAFSQTSPYPSALDTTTTLTDLADRAQTTLSAGLNSSATSFTVVSGSKFTAHMILSIDNEQIKIWSVVGNTVHVGDTSLDNVDGRGYAGTSAASHTSGALVSDYFVSWQFKALRNSLIAIETTLGINPNIATIPNPLTVNKGGTGVQTGTGIPVASGTTAFSFAAASSDLQYLRSKPNQTSRTYEFAPSPTVNAADYNWSQQPGSTINATPTSSTVTLVPCPLGIAGAETTMHVHLSGGTGSPTAEDPVITGGTCTSGAASGTITFVATSARTGSWTATSSTGGIGEAWWTLSTGGEIRVAKGTITQTAALTAPYGNVTLRGTGANATVIKAGTAAFVPFIYVDSLIGVRFQGITFDGNFPTFTAAYTIALWFNSAIDFEVSDCAFRYMGFSGAPVYDATNYANTHSILMVSSRRGRVARNRFNSNFGADIQVQLASDVSIEDNESGTPSVSDALTSTNYWDTQGTAPGFVFGGTSYIRVNRNRIYGGIRFSDTWGKGGPIRLVNCAFCEVNDNIVTGMNAGYGTLSVTNGSGTVTGTSTYFSTIVGTSTNSDVQAILMIEGDGTQYHISAVASGTSITVTPVVARGTASGLRYQLATSGDLLGCSPCYYSTISNNVGTYSGDEGLSLGQAGGGAAFQHNVVANDVLMFNRLCGGVIDEQAYDDTFVGNVFANNHQGTGIVAAGDRGGLCLLTSAGKAINNNSFVSNRFYDDQGTQTQLYAFDFDTTDLADIALNNARGNDFATVTFTNVTASQWNGMFRQPVYDNPPMTAAVASGATIAATGTLFHITGTSAIDTITLPSGFVAGEICAIADGAWTTTTAGNIGAVSQAVVGRTLCWQYDPVTNKLHPNSTLYPNNALGAAVASGGTIAATGTLFHMTGTSAIDTMTLPTGFTKGQVCVIADAAYTTTTAGNFAETNLGVVNETICYHYDPATSKWYGPKPKDYGADVASATTTALGTGNVFTITGTTTITTLNTCDATDTGRRVTLIFAGILTFTDGNNLKLAGNFVTTADDSITLVCNGTNWYEVSRSVN